MSQILSLSQQPLLQQPLAGTNLNIDAERVSNSLQSLATHSLTFARLSTVKLLALHCTVSSSHPDYELLPYGLQFLSQVAIAYNISFQLPTNLSIWEVSNTLPLAHLAAYLLTRSKSPALAIQQQLD